MRAAVLEEFNKVTIQSLEIPELNYGQVLVKVHASSICGAQINEIHGAAGHDKYLPHLLGHEGCGIVVEIGPGVSFVEPCDRVVMHWRKGLGIEGQPPKYKNMKGVTIGGGYVTTFNEYAIVAENRLTPIGEDIPYEIGALMGCAVTTALGLINNEAKLKIGQSIAIAGCGGVGLNIIQGAVMVSANPIIAIDIIQKKLDMARRFGATHVINGQSLYEMKELVDVFVDCTGQMDVVDIGYKLTVPGGKIILVGQPDHGQSLIISNMRQHYCGKMLMDSQGGLTNPSVDIPRYLNLYREGKLQLDDLITHHYLLKEINEAIIKVKSRDAGKCMLVM